MKRIARVLAACVLILTATLAVHAGLKKLWQRRLLTSVAKESDLPYVWAVSFSPDSSAVAVGMNTRSLTRPRVVLVDPSRKLSDRIIDITTKSAWPDLSWSPDGRYLLVRTESYEKSNEVIEIASGAIVRIDKGECEAWGLIDGPVVVRQCKPTFDRIVIRFTRLDGTELDPLTLDGNVWIEDWNEERGWLALQHLASPAKSTEPSRAIVLQLSGRRETASKTYTNVGGLRQRFVPGTTTLCSFPWSGQHKKLEPADCWDVSTGRTVATPMVQGSGFYGPIETGGSRIVTNDVHYIPFPIEGGAIVGATRRSVWDLSSRKRIALWTPESQQNLPNPTSNSLAGFPFTRQPMGKFQSSLSRDGKMIAMGGDNQISIYRID